LKETGLSQDIIQEINLVNSGESRCMEVLEFVNYLESIEPFSPKNNFRSTNMNRRIKDLFHVKKIKGIKFDLPYESKIELWKRLQQSVNSLKENTNIDFTNYNLPPPPP